MGEIYEDFIIAAFLHDVIYDPKANNNEEKSNEYFISLANRDTLGQNLQIVVGLIMCTKERLLPSDKYQSIFWSMDNNILINGTIDKLIEYENNIFKEFQFAKYEVYKAKRLDFLNGEIKHNKNIEFLIFYINNRKLN
jgi:predicted metal-dependent HD superfamily phosphohydrolase